MLTKSCPKSTFYFTRHLENYTLELIWPLSSKAFGTLCMPRSQALLFVLLFLLTWLLHNHLGKSRKKGEKVEHSGGASQPLKESGLGSGIPFPHPLQTLGPFAPGWIAQPQGVLGWTFGHPRFRERILAYHSPLLALPPSLRVRDKVRLRARSRGRSRNREKLRAGGRLREGVGLTGG